MRALKRYTLVLLLLGILVGPAFAQDGDPVEEGVGDQIDEAVAESTPAAETPTPTPIIIVVTATPEPSPIVIVVTATPEPGAVPETTSATATPVGDGASGSRTDGLVGQNGTFCKSTQRFSLRVVSATEPRADIVAVLIDATNLGSRSEDIFHMIDLRDERGRLFDMAGTSEYPRYYDELRPLRASGVISNVTNIQPGRTERVYAVFLLAPDSASVRLAQHRPPCA